MERLFDLLTDALRPLTLCNCDSKLLTSVICVEAFIGTLCDAFTPSQTDNIFEIETTALAHVACAPQESGVLLTDFAAVYPSVSRSVASCEVFIKTASHTWNLQEQNGDNSLWPEEYNKVVLREVSFCNGLRPNFPMAPRNYYPKEPPTTWNSCSLHNALTLTISLMHHSLFES